MSERACSKCGCTDDDCRQCIEKTGHPCWWVREDLCSACADNPAGPTRFDGWFQLRRFRRMVGQR